MTWSTPYYGITHMNGLKSGYRITVRAYPGFAECALFGPGTRLGETTHTTADEAKAHGEDRARALGIIDL